MNERFRMTAKVDDAELALQLATRIHGLVKIRHDVLEYRRTSTDQYPNEGMEWIGLPHTHQDSQISALCDSLAALLRAGSEVPR